MAAPQRFWLLKTEPTAYSLDDLKRDGRTGWGGVRNYQARNLLRDELKPGDGILFYHSNAEPPGVAGLARVTRGGHPDPTAWRKGDVHFDPASTPTRPVWFQVEIEFTERFPRFVPLEEIRACHELQDMVLLKRSRLSVQPLEKHHFDRIARMGRRTSTGSARPAEAR